MGVRVRLLLTVFFSTWNILVSAQNSSEIDQSTFELIYNSNDPSYSGNGARFNIRDPFLNNSGACVYRNPQQGGQRPTPIPLNVVQYCSPRSFQYKIISRDGPCGPKVEISHAISIVASNMTTVKAGTLTLPCPSRGSSRNSSDITVATIPRIAPAGTPADVYTPSSNATYFVDFDTTYHGPQFLPSETFNDTIANGSVIPGQIPTFFGCVCNCSYVSYACCDAQNGIVHEPSINNLGHLNNCPNNENGRNSTNDFEDISVPSPITSVPSPVSTTPSESHYVCSGYCYGAARQCSYGYTGDCKCSAPTNVFLFWMSAPCVATEQNPNKQHDKRHEKRELWLQPGYRGPTFDPGREPGICNSSYVSYACKDAKDGIVHEPLANWLGAMLPAGVKEYPPIPQEFLDVHGIAEQPKLGPVDLPFW